MQQLGRGRGPGRDPACPLREGRERPNRVALVALHNHEPVGHGLGNVGPVRGRHPHNHGLFIPRG
eukprot:1376196-Lingulodinium_polyedra.AAC.1